MKTVKVTISPNGSSAKTEVNGVQGQACEEITKQMVEAFGQVTETEKKPEFYTVDEQFVTNQT